jgi:polysaccharide transporter, PST family
MKFFYRLKKFKKNILNSGWLIVDRVVRMMAGLVIGVWIARYLGPAQFGNLNFALAFFAPFAVLSNFGLDQIVVRDLSKKMKSDAIILGSTFLLKMIGGVLAIASSCICLYLFRENDSQLLLMVFILSLGSLFQGFDVIDYFYQAKLQSKIAVYAKSLSLIVCSILKVILIIYGYPLIFFVLVIAFEAVLCSLGLVLSYRLSGHFIHLWRVKFDEIKRLIKQGAPLFFSSLLVVLYIRIDQLMIGEILGSEQLGIYSAAVRLTEVWYFIPMAISASILPTLVAAKIDNQYLYKKILQNLYGWMAIASLVVATLLTIFSDQIVDILFGDQYTAASSVLAIQCWSGLFIFSGLINNQWYLLENLNRFTLYRSILGLIINIVLNLFFIPLWGIEGAAWATVLTQLVISFFFEILHPLTRPLFFIRSRAIINMIHWIYIHCFNFKRIF